MRYTVVKQVRNSRKRDYGSENDYAEAYIRVFIKYFTRIVSLESKKFGSLQVHTGYPTFPLKKTCVIYFLSCSLPLNFVG